MTEETKDVVKLLIHHLKITKSYLDHDINIQLEALVKEEPKFRVNYFMFANQDKEIKDKLQEMIDYLQNQITVKGW